MVSTNINVQDAIFALDIGTRSVIGTVGIVKNKKFHVLAESYFEHEERAMIDGQIHDIGLVAFTVNKVKKELEEKINFKLSKVAIAAAGRFLKTITAKTELNIEQDREIDKDIIRSLELTAVKHAEDEINKETDGKLYCVGYSVKNYYLNGYLISNLISHKGETIACEVIATFLPRSVVDSIYSVMSKVELDVVSLTLEPIAAMEAAIPKSLRLLNLALVDIGAGTSDIAISSKDSISAYGMVSLAGDEVTEVIAQNCLVDFNTAEKIKREASLKEIVKYTDVLGLENEIESEEVMKIIKPTIEKISEEIGRKIVELNGGKAPNAVFLVGGGSYTPGIKETIARKLNLPDQRIGLKGRDAVADCVCLDNNLGSVGVTVLGIALVSIKKLGHDFIDVILNGTVISLFNSYKHTVIDVMLQGGINPKILMGKNGRNIKFFLNGIKRVAFGTLASNAEIKINNMLGSIDSEIKEGDRIDITFAKDGIEAKPRVKDYIKKLYSVSFFLNDILCSIEPIGIINNEKANIDDEIKEGDYVEIINLETLGQYIKYYELDEGFYKYYIDNKEVFKDYVIKEGDRIYRVKDDVLNKNEIKENNIDKNRLDGKSKDKNIDYIEESISEDTASINKNEFGKEKTEITVVVNDKKINMSGKDKYVFVDIFDYIEFDLTKAKGNLVTLVNGVNTGYTNELNDGDIIEIRWE